MLSRLITIFALITLPLLAKDFDPFAPDGNSPVEMLKTSVAAAKPLTLEICYGETDLPIDNENLPGQLTQLQIPVAATDQGRVIHRLSGDTCDVLYRVSPDDHGLKIELTFDQQSPASSPGAATRRQININPTLTPSENWLFVGGLTREQITQTATGETTSKVNFVIGLRLQPTQP